MIQARTAPYLRRMKLGQFQEREAVPVSWWRQLAELALLLVLAGILARCAKLPPVLTPPCEPLAAQLDAAKAAVEAACAGGESEPCTGARVLVADLQALLDQYHPGGCPVPEPSSPPVTQPPSTPPTTNPQTPPTPPPAAGCVLAGEPSQALPESYKPAHQAAVLAAIRRVVPTCLFGDCLINDWTQQTFQAAVQAEVRKGGKDPSTGQTFAPLCAGQHGKGTDEISVASDSTSPMEGYNVFSGDDSETVPNPGNRRTIMWAKYMGAWYPPTVAPTPAPTATPEASCPAPRPDQFRNPATKQDCLFSWGFSERPAKWRDKDGGLVQGLDATLTVARCCDFCKAISLGEYGGQMRCSCPLRSEGQPAEREQCEAWAGAVWEVRGGTLVPNPANRAQASCDGVGCELRVCTAIEPKACGEWKKP